MLVRQSLSQIDRRSHGRASLAPADANAGGREHGDVDSACLEPDKDESEEGCEEHGCATADPVENIRIRDCRKDAADVDSRSAQTEGCVVDVEVVKIRRDDVEPIPDVPEISYTLQHTVPCSG